MLSQLNKQCFEVLKILEVQRISKVKKCENYFYVTSMNLFSILHSLSFLFHFLFLLYLLCQNIWHFILVFYSYFHFFVLNLTLTILNCLNSLSHNLLEWSSSFSRFFKDSWIQYSPSSYMCKWLFMLFFKCMALILKNILGGYEILGSHFCFICLL